MKSSDCKYDFLYMVFKIEMFHVWSCLQCKHLELLFLKLSTPKKVQSPSFLGFIVIAFYAKGQFALQRKLNCKCKNNVAQKVISGKLEVSLMISTI